MTRRFVLSVLTAAVLMVPLAASAQIQNNTPMSFEIKTINEFLNGNQNTPDTQATVAKVDPNIEILKNYLISKGSPLADYSEHLLKQENWKLILAIANGESTLCKHQMYNNCWGIGGAWNLKRYISFAEGFRDVDHLLAEKYIATGADTPEEIVYRYVGSYSPTWVLAVNQILSQLDQLPLQN